LFANAFITLANLFITLSTTSILFTVYLVFSAHDALLSTKNLN
jgi:hypothetical protein